MLQFFYFGEGTFDIKITSGRYSYVRAKPEANFGCIWIWGCAQYFITKTQVLKQVQLGHLNGYNKTLRWKVKDKAVINACF
jgi:hypothetical protein